VKDCYTDEEVNRFCENADENGRKFGAMNEQRRIIELLEREVAAHYERGLKGSGYYLEKIIERIKGEQK